MIIDDNFPIKAYGKGELASLYMPDISSKSAYKILKKWIEKYPGLNEALAQEGYLGTERKFTPQQVRIIVGCLGEP